MKITTCRICGSPFVRVLSLGELPLVNRYLTEEETHRPEEKFPLNFCLCETCGLGQLDEIVPPSFFVDYHYKSSTSLPLKLHLESLGELCRELFQPARVMDIGCNDGALLGRLHDRGIETLGVDPSKNVVAETQAREIPVVSDFFNERLAGEIARTAGRFDVIVATNTMAQIIDLHDFVRGLDRVLADQGVFVGEVGYLGDMVREITFDSIYHEHYSYFSLKSLIRLFEPMALRVFDAQPIDNHGGSLRFFVGRRTDASRRPSARMESILAAENVFGLDKAKSYREFAAAVVAHLRDFRNLLLDLKNDGQTIVGLGSPAKAVILLNSAAIDASIVDYVTDSTPLKQNRFMPGVHIPIKSEDVLRGDPRIDNFLILAWTYKDAMLEKIAALDRPRANVILPFPSLNVLRRAPSPSPEIRGTWLRVKTATSAMAMKAFLPFLAAPWVRHGIFHRFCHHPFIAAAALTILAAIVGISRKLAL